MLKKKMVSVLLAAAMVMGLGGTALAAENEKAAAERAAAEEAEMLEFLAMDEGNLSPEIIKKYYTMTEEEVAAIQTENNDNAVSTQMASAPTENINVAIRRMAAQATAIAGPYSAICSMPTTDLGIMLKNMESGGVNSEIYAQNYNGQMCYLFSNGTKNVYVKASAFYTTAENGKIFPADSTVSLNLTSYANMKDSSSLCSTRVSCSSAGNSVYNWEVTQIASQTMTSGGVFRVVKSKIPHSVSFATTPHCLTVYSINNITSYQPELTLEITNGGSNNAFFDSFYVLGQGTYIEPIDISSWIKLGYNISQIFSPDFSAGTLIDIVEDAEVVLKPNERYEPCSYRSETIALSNEYTHAWIRRCGMKAPFSLGGLNNNYELHAGLCNGSSTVKYKVTVQYHF